MNVYASSSKILNSKVVTHRGCDNSYAYSSKVNQDKTRSCREYLYSQNRNTYKHTYIVAVI